MSYDPGIAPFVTILQEGGIETFESCEGGPGHAFPEPTIRFHGGPADGPKAVGVALTFGLPILELRRVWTLLDKEITGPQWEMTFRVNAIDHLEAENANARRVFAHMGRTTEWPHGHEGLGIDPPATQPTGQAGEEG